MMYYYVPPCPHCGSAVTGRLLYGMMGDAAYIEENSLRHGELALVLDEPSTDNAYCEACGHTWRAEIPIRHLSRKEVEEEKKKRGIPDMSDMEEEKKKHGIFRRALTWLTGI